MAVLELLIFAVLAAVVLYQLYAILGRRVGRHAEDTLSAPVSGGPTVVEGAARAAAAAVSPSGLAAVRAGDPAFDPAKFLVGAGQAYPMIVRAFAAGDRAALTPLVSADVLAAFGRAIDAREAEGRSETIEFTVPPRVELESLEAEDGLARAKVRYLAEFRSRTKGPEGEAVDDRRTAEVWTFERRLADRDPNWILARVDAAEA